MSQLELQSGHQAAKEITPFSTWLVTRVVILAAAILSLTPFAVSYVAR